jgi:hypothetical protein
MPEDERLLPENAWDLESLLAEGSLLFTTQYMKIRRGLGGKVIYI